MVQGPKGSRSVGEYIVFYDQVIGRLEQFVCVFVGAGVRGVFTPCKFYFKACCSG